MEVHKLTPFIYEENTVAINYFYMQYNIISQTAYIYKMEEEKILN